MSAYFEYGNQFKVADRAGLENYLCSIWSEYKQLWLEPHVEDASKSRRSYQPFLTFDGSLARSNNFVGFINFKNEAIEIYPKVFQNLDGNHKQLMHDHLFYWLKYCNRLKFPFIQSYLDTTDIQQLPELILYLIARQFTNTVKEQPYSSYEEVHQALEFPKGRINFGRFAKTVSYGQYNQIDCDYEPFIFDNALNRIIKYCTRLLISKTQIAETQNILNETLFLLDEVEDQPCSIHQLSGIQLPSLFQVYEDVIHSCKMILENQAYSYVQYELKNWSLLFPMEYVFENFIAGFIKAHFSKEFLVEPQKSDLYLHETPNTFNIQHDVLLTNRTTKQSIIVDAKYKPRWGDMTNDPKKGVSQSDLYQMISYAFKRGTDKVLLIYPNTSDKLLNDHVFRVNSHFENKVITIKVVDVPFWSGTDYKTIETNLKQKLSRMLTNPD